MLSNLGSRYCWCFIGCLLFHNRPNNDELFNGIASETPAEPESVDRANAAASYQIWGFDRDARNIDPDLRAEGSRFQFIEIGVHNFLQVKGKEVSESGELMVMVQGVPLWDDDILAATRRVVFSIAGVVWTPKVFDVVRCCFCIDADASAHDLTFPCDVKIKQRPNRVSELFETVDFQTSAEFIAEWMHHFEYLDLYELEYDIVDDDEIARGSLLWSRITAATKVGRLWDAGLKKILLADQLALDRKRKRDESALDTLRRSDPMAELPPRRPRRCAPRAGRGGRSSGSRGRGGAAARGSPLDEALVAVVDEPVEGEILPPPADQFEGERYDGPVVGALRDEMDMADDELESWVGSDLDELVLAEGERDDMHADRVVPADPLAGELYLPAIGAADEAMVEVIARTLDEEVALEVGLVGGSRGSDEGASVAHPAMDLAPVAALMPWQEMGDVSPLGYFYHGGRSVLRVLRNRPPGSVTINCYRHPGCHLFLTVGRCPDDTELKKWLWESPSAVEGASAKVRKELAVAHMNIAKAKWTKKGVAASTT
jgi:hypothetical protein